MRWHIIGDNKKSSLFYVDCRLVAENYDNQFGMRLVVKSKIYKHLLQKHRKVLPETSERKMLYRAIGETAKLQIEIVPSKHKRFVYVKIQRNVHFVRINLT